jgi:hypothetical protein
MSYRDAIHTTTPVRIKSTGCARYLGAMKPLLLWVWLGLGLAQDSTTEASQEEPVEAGRVLLDVRQPVQIDLDGQTVGQLYRSGEIQMEVPEGEHVLRVHLNGEASEHPLIVRGRQTTYVLISEGGVFTPERDEEASEAQPFTQLTLAAHADQAFLV